MVFAKRMEKWAEQRFRSTTPSPLEKGRARVDGKDRTTDKTPMHANTYPDVSRQQRRQSMRTEDYCLPNRDVSRAHLKGPESTVTPINPTPLGRLPNAVQDSPADTHHKLQRIPTPQSVKERPHDTLIKVAGDPPRINTVIPGPILQEEAAIDSDYVYDEVARKIAALRDRDHDLTNSLKEKEEKIRQQGIYIQELIKAENECISKIAALETQLREERGQNTKLTQVWKRSVAELSQARRLEASYKVDDKSLEALYQELVFIVASWADSYCVPDMKQLSKSEVEPFLALTTVPGKYLRRKKTQSLLLKSLAMQMLVDDVFTVSAKNRSGLWWAGNQAQELRTMYNALMPAEPHAIPALLERGTLRSADVKDFSQWKAKSALLLSQHVEPPELDANIEILLIDWKKKLTPFVKCNDSRVWRDLNDIVKNAVNLDLELNRSRALFMVRHWSAEELGKLDQARLEAAAGFGKTQPGVTVELVLAPALTKTGSADGEAFETMLFISNWIVVSTESRENVEKIPKKGSQQ